MEESSLNQTELPDYPLIDNTEIDNNEIINENQKIDSFIFLGKTGVGKTSIINLLCNSNNKVSDGPNSETKTILKEEAKYLNTEKKYFCLDTVGFEDKDISDKENKNKIQDYLIENKDILIKGIFYIINFQDKKLDKTFWKVFYFISEIFPTYKEFWKYIIFCFTNTYPDRFKNLETMKEDKLKFIKEEISKKMDELNEKKNWKNRTKWNTIYIIFIDIYSGKAYENLKNSSNFENIEKSNNEHKNNLQNIIFKFKDKKPMYFLIDEKIIKDEFAFKIVEKDKTYAFYKVDYKEIIYKDFLENIISRKLKLLKEVFYKNVKDSIWEKKK